MIRSIDGKKAGCDRYKKASIITTRVKSKRNRYLETNHKDKDSSKAKIPPVEALSATCQYPKRFKVKQGIFKANVEMRRYSFQCSRGNLSIYICIK